MEKRPDETLEEYNIRKIAELEGRADDHEAEEAHETMADVGEALSVRDRLIRRTKRRVFDTAIDTIDDDGKVSGEIIIKTRMLTSSERARAVILISELEKQKDEETRDILMFNETTKGIGEILADVAVDPEIQEYFKVGESTDDVLIAVLTSTMEQSLEAIGDSISRFREERDRSSPT